MRLRVCAVKASSYADLAARLLAALGTGLVLLLASPQPSLALTGCVSGGACLARHTDGSGQVEIKQDLEGGDATAGSQIIGVGGTAGSVEIDADNRSEFSRARGGDAESKMKVRGRASTPSSVQGSSVSVATDATGTVGITQTARPRARATSTPLETEMPPLAPATGGSFFSSTATAAGGVSVVQELEVVASPEILLIAAPARPLPIVVRSGGSKVVLRSKGSAVSGAAVAGGQVIGVVGVTGQTVINATNRSVFASARSGDARAKLDLAAAAGARLRVPPSSLALGATVHSEAVAGQTATPDVSMDLSGDGNADVTADASVTQFATLESAPSITVLAGEQTLGGEIHHDGDATAKQKVDLVLASGDAVAGAQVIGLAGVSGNVTIDATNRSRFATARGGDAKARLRADVEAGPRLVPSGSGSPAGFNAEGIPANAQTLSPRMTLADTRPSSSSKSQGGAAPGLTMDGSGAAGLVGRATVQQTANTSSGPTAYASER